MKSKKDNADETLDEALSSETAFRRRFRVVSGSERSVLRDRILSATRPKKSRITIYFDSDLIRKFKEKGEKEGVGYQTLMNDALRRSADAETDSDLKNSMLNDKQFLERLKSALSV